MNFGKRLKLYLGGFLIGTLVVYFFVYKDRNIYKSPEEIILERAAGNPTQYSERSACILKCIQVGDSIADSLWRLARVSYKESDVRKKPNPVYRIYFSANKNGIDWARLEQDPMRNKVLDIGLVAGVDSCACPL
ncbi:MAG: hypothetical protein RLZZ46_1150 [Bacteroidota bacterium]|jgi:hypothetical protein